MRIIKLLTSCLLFATLFGTCGSLMAQAPKGKLIYCSYSETRAGGLGKSYCEMIADPGTKPKIVVVLFQNCHYADERNGEFNIKKSDVSELQQMLENAEVYKIDGYKHEELVEGGTTCRIYMEYDTGEKINASWYGHGVSEEALADFAMIKDWFKPWRDRVIGVEQ